MDEPTDRDLDRLVAAIDDADDAVALTGAGVSAPSGIPTFRGEDGIWGGRFDQTDFHADRLARDPAGFWTDRLELREHMRPDDLAPNAAHEALADLESAGYLAAVITQNTDGLHAAAGSDRVIELHGSAARVACQRCGSHQPADPAFERARDGELPPTCGCGGVLRPDVVLFGESLDQDDLRRARRYATDADVFLAVGSSLSVQPAASLAGIAARDGALWICNFDSTPYDGRADGVLSRDVTEVLPAVFDRLRSTTGPS